MNDVTRGGRVAPRAAPARPAATPTRRIAALRAADRTQGAHSAGRAGTARGATRPVTVVRLHESSGLKRGFFRQGGGRCQGGWTP